MYFLTKRAPEQKSKRFWYAVLSTVLISFVFTGICILLFGSYGLALFIIIPFFAGFHPVKVYAKNEIVPYDLGVGMTLLTLLFLCLGVLIFALDGLICIVMASPILISFALIGMSVALSLQKKLLKSQTIIWILMLSIPVMSFIEKDNPIESKKVKTAIMINSPIEVVWKNVITFPKLEKPEEFIFKAGISYPINATIQGKGVGSIRYCNFTTGSFVEPITTWKQPHLLAFDVLKQPEPMQEISFYDLNAPHLHDYFVSQKGQFRLVKLSNTKTLLEGTTWYYHKIKPVAYWSLWSNYIIHKIHMRVLSHIKKTSEHRIR